MRYLINLLTIVFLAFLLLYQGRFIMAEEPKLDEIFKQEGYPNPIIHVQRDIKEIPGLRYYEVYDKSQAAEDPIVLGRFVVTKGHKVYNAWDVAQAVLEIGYYPMSEDEATQISRILIQIIYDDAQIKKTAVVKRRDYYEVVLDTYTPEEIVPMMDMKIKDAIFSKHIVKIGKGICEIN